MKHIDDGDVRAGHLGYRPGIASGGINHVFGDQVTLVGDHLPCTGWQQVDIGNTGVALDRRAHGARTGGERVATSSRIDMTVHGRVRATDDTIGLNIWKQALDFRGVDDFHIEADNWCEAGDVAEPVSFSLVEREADATLAMPADVLSRHFLQLWIERIPVVVNLGHRIVANEAWTKTSGMPGGARGQLSLFDQDAIRPAFFGEIIKKPAAHHAAADDYNACLRNHDCSALRIKFAASF